jgi:hypothetical protein
VMYQLQVTSTFTGIGIVVSILSCSVRKLAQFDLAVLPILFKASQSVLGGKCPF